MSMRFSGKTVVVTGAAGFIGSHLCDHLLSEGASVIGVDNLLTGRLENLSHLLDDNSTSKNFQFTFINADVIQPTDSYLPAGQVLDYVFHFASPASPPRYQAHPIETYQVNVWGTHHLLQYLHTHSPAARFIFASTSEVYGDPQLHPQPESYWGNVNPNGIRSCYDEAKRLGETICGIHHRDLGMDVRIVRIFNTFGPRIDPVDGRVIPQFVSQALANQPLTVYGDGSQTRSYCFVDDLVEGILRLASQEGLAGETINIGNPGEYTVKETAEIVYQLIHLEATEVPFDWRPLPKDDPTRRRPDITKAQQVLGWQPVISLADGLKTTIAYFQRSSA
ncbi:MAG TPA: NAD-dependent epimerase/dehydratase family protein [Vitreimonas sp.]|nr:NAD-dependent epimerase/dehydratase family protein [Vitreimonas sp.]